METKYKVMPKPKGKRENIMTIEIYTNTLTLIQKALPYLRQGLMEKVLQKSEKFQNNILKIITGIEDGTISEVILQDWSQYVECKSSNGGSYYFGTHYYYEPEENMWLKQYETSADMEFCPVCSMFGNHEEYDEETGEFIGYTCREPEYYRSCTMIRIIVKFMLKYADDMNYCTVTRTYFKEVR